MDCAINAFGIFRRLLSGYIPSGWFWPDCGSEVINLLAEYRPFNSFTWHHASRN
jgi:hypothetical protein